MFVVDWIAQVVLFFVAWRLFYYLTAKANRLSNQGSVVIDVAVNLAVAILLLIVLSNLHSLWWTMPVVGAAIGVCSGQMSILRQPEEN